MVVKNLKENCKITKKILRQKKSTNGTGVEKNHFLFCLFSGVKTVKLCMHARHTNSCLRDM